MKSTEQGEIVSAHLMPHAPVLIPEIGRGRELEAQQTVDSMRRAAEEIVATDPDCVLVISPHAPRRSGQFGVYGGERLEGDMSRFGHSEVTVSVPNDAEVVRSLEWAFPSNGLQTWKVMGEPLDHGAFVPLHFLARAGWQGLTVVMGLDHPGEGKRQEAGDAIRESVVSGSARVALIASGDMSHSLLPNAPCGFQPRAKEFDAAFVRRIQAGRFDELEEIDGELQALASEDVVDSTLIAAHALKLSSFGHELFSYEGPFGVGYCVARLFDGKKMGPAGGNLLPAIARNAVESKLQNGPGHVQWPQDRFFDQPAGVFVTIRNRSGELRGCRGTIEPQHDNLIDETQSVAVSSAFRDPRFEPVYLDELADLNYEVSVLHRAEAVDSREELDPHRYGVIITTPDGRRGLMLPEVEGLDTVEEQIRATCRKARIQPDEPMTFQRFRVDKFTEN